MMKKSHSKTFRHLEGLKVKALFSDCGNFRYLMEIKKEGKSSGERLCTIMLNPSVADEKQADKSVQFLEKLIFKNTSLYFKNVGVLTIVNLFAYIQTRKFEGSPEQVGPLNDHYLHKAISKSDMVLIAWGKTCDFPARQEVIMNILQELPEKPVFITKSHPSRGTYNNFVSPFSPNGKGPS